MRANLFSLAALMAFSSMAYAGGRLSYTDSDIIFRRDTPRPVQESADTTLKLWQGERAGFAAMFVPDAPTGRLTVRVEAADGKLPMTADARFIDYVLTNDHKACGWPADSLPVYEVADALVRSDAAEAAAGALRPVWVTVDVPHDAAPGKYKGNLIVADRYAGADLDTLSFTLEVTPNRLPLPDKQQFYINFWQQPYAVSRYYKVKPWSDEHFKYLAPYADLLARAGQRVVSAILFYEPWGQQSNDKFEPMVETILGSDGRWRYDYSVFDRYVEFMGEHGINGEIDCFTMIPWDQSYRYLDEATGEYKFIQCKPGSKEYAELWTSFLKSFQKHLKSKGWDKRAMISIDERSLPDMQNAIAIAKKAAPGMKMALAGNFHPEIADDLYSYTLTLGDPFPEGVIDRRRKDGKISLYYTCCSSPEPNIFSNNNPIDASYIPVFCIANGADGYLHWAFTNWTDNPMTDTRFFMFAPGDTYCAYPDGGSSLRWERMIEGVQLTEKINQLRKALKADSDALSQLDEALAPFIGAVPPPAADRRRHYNNLKEVVTNLSEKLK